MKLYEGIASGADSRSPEVEQQPPLVDDEHGRRCVFRRRQRQEEQAIGVGPLAGAESVANGLRPLFTTNIDP